jgi:hypothetical protein
MFEIQVANLVEIYNFGINFISIQVFTKKLWFFEYMLSFEAKFLNLLDLNIISIIWAQKWFKKNICITKL